MGRHKSPLEWTQDQITTADGTLTNGRIALRMDRNEVAEIRRVTIDIMPGVIDDAADDSLVLAAMASMDPNVIASPFTAAGREDLEVFLIAQKTVASRVGGVGTAIWVETGQQAVLDLPEGYPILLGGDMGWVVAGDADVSVTFLIQVYFTRRPTRPNEKFNVLLSRR